MQTGPTPGLGQHFWYRTVEFTTTSNTKAQKFTVRVETNTYGLGLGNTTADYQNGEFKGDEVDVKVEKGAVTIVAAGTELLSRRGD